MKYNHTTAQKGFAPLILIIVIVAVIISTGTGGYLLVSKNKNIAKPLPSSVPSPSPAASSLQQSKPVVVQAPSTTTLVGFWKMIEAFSFDPQTKSWKQGVPSSPSQPLYFEFKDDGTTCNMFNSQGGYHCSKYVPYTVSGDIITENQEGTVGSPWRYRWSLNNDKLELVAEVLTGSIWQQFIKYILTQVPKPPEPQPATPATSSSGSTKDSIVPVVASVDFVQSSQSNTRKVTIHCRVTDETALGPASIGLMYPGDNPPSGTIWWQNATTEDSDVKNQTWSQTFDAVKSGIYHAVCEAVDKAGNHSERTFKEFNLP